MNKYIDSFNNHLRFCESCSAFKSQISIVVSGNKIPLSHSINFINIDNCAPQTHYNLCSGSLVKLHIEGEHESLEAQDILQTLKLGNLFEDEFSCENFARFANSTEDVMIKYFNIRIRKGLHTRPSAAVVNLARRFECEIYFFFHPHPEFMISAKKIIEVMSLAAPNGTGIGLIAIGKDAFLAAEALLILFENESKRFENESNGY